MGNGRATSTQLLRRLIPIPGVAGYNSVGRVHE
jgi:hypothetical protein